jgi:pyruvate dehydrogenase E2 component (dihydrolipoamide acetyltransferase)
MDIKLPFLGDGIDSATVLSILVSPGDSVDLDQSIMELETDKAVAPVPAPAAGKIADIKVKAGDTVSTGMLVATLEGGGAQSSPDSKSQSSPQTTAPVQPVAPVQSAAPVVQASQPAGNYQFVSPSGQEPPASPSIRKIALDLGLDLGRVQGTGNGGRLTLDDVRGYMSFLQASAFSKPAEASTNTAQAAQPSGPKPLNVDFSKWGSITIDKVSTMRQKISEKMTEAWQTVPHVTQQDDANIDHAMTLRKKYKAKYEKKNAGLTITGISLKALVTALKEFPHFNASFDAAAGNLITKNYYNIGVAVDTPYGLIVPVIKNVDKKTVFELSVELGEIAQKARDRKLGLDDLQGGTFTLSNLGGLGVSYFTPIINTPEVAILGMGRGKTASSLPLCLSYDHRVIDGGDGARFIKTFINALETFPEKDIKI